MQWRAGVADLGADQSIAAPRALAVVDAVRSAGAGAARSLAGV